MADETNKEKTLVDFWAPWCGPCRMIGASLEKLETESTIKIKKINIDEDQDTAKQYRVMSIPTLILMENGEEKDRKVGTLPYSKLKAWVDEFMKS